MPSTRWEYRTIDVNLEGFFIPEVNTASLDDMMNSLGNDGWELVTAFDVNRGHGRSSSVVATFKRPRS